MKQHTTETVEVSLVSRSAPKCLKMGIPDSCVQALHNPQHRPVPKPDLTPAPLALVGTKLVESCKTRWRITEVVSEKIVQTLRRKQAVVA